MHTGARSKTPAPPPIVYLASDIREEEQPYPSTNKLIDPRINFYKNTKFSVNIVPLEILDSEINDNCPNHRSFKTVYENHEHILTFSVVSPKLYEDAESQLTKEGYKDLRGRQRDIVRQCFSNFV